MMEYVVQGFMLLFSMGGAGLTVYMGKFILDDFKSFRSGVKADFEKARNDYMQRIDSVLTIMNQYRTTEDRMILELKGQIAPMREELQLFRQTVANLRDEITKGSIETKAAGEKLERLEKFLASHFQVTKNVNALVNKHEAEIKTMKTALGQVITAIKK